MVKTLGCNNEGAVGQPDGGAAEESEALVGGFPIIQPISWVPSFYPRRNCPPVSVMRSYWESHTSAGNCGINENLIEILELILSIPEIETIWAGRSCWIWVRLAIS